MGLKTLKNETGLFQFFRCDRRVDEAQNSLGAKTHAVHPQSLVSHDEFNEHLIRKVWPTALWEHHKPREPLRYLMKRRQSPSGEGKEMTVPRQREEAVNK